MKQEKSIIIALVAGEISGDILGAGLIRSLRGYLQNVLFVGIAGPRMQEEGMESWYDMEELSVMGIVETFKSLPRLLYIRRNLIKRFTILKPKVFIGIDAPDFNIKLERQLKRRGIRTLHYVSPSIWAWRKKRIFKIGQATDNILAFLPFEKKIYDRYDIPCRFIGHTMADSMPLHPNKVAARLELDIPVSKLCLVLLPGSRQSEVEMLSADFLRCAALLKKQFSDLEIIVPLVNMSRRTQFERIKLKIMPEMSVRLLNNNQAQKAMIAADVALVASGTATLECMLAKCPMVVGYRMKPINFALAKLLVKTPWISLPNLLAEREVVKEVLQDMCQPDILAAFLKPLLNDDKQRRMLQDTFYHFHKKIRCNADEQAARAVLALI